MKGSKFLLANLNQINENAQNIIDKTSALYVFNLVFNDLSVFLVLYGVANLILIFNFSVSGIRKNYMMNASDFRDCSNSIPFAVNRPL